MSNLEDVVQECLKPCPLCGGKARVLAQRYGYSVDCLTCQLFKPVHSNDLKQLIREWNRRVPNT